MNNVKETESAVLRAKGKEEGMANGNEATMLGVETGASTT